MTLMIKILRPIRGKSPGDVVILPRNIFGKIDDPYWQRHLDSAVESGRVEIVKRYKSKPKKAAPKSVKEKGE